MTTNEECKVFANSESLIATKKSGVSYEVTGSYLDANGCMKTYSYNDESFIADTKFTQK